MKRVVAAVLLVTACGGGGSGGSSEKKAYLDKAEAICERANDQLEEAKKSQPTSSAAVSGYVKKLVDIAGSNLDGLAELQPPADDRSDIDGKVLQPLRTQLEAARAYQGEVDAAVAAKDNATLLRLVQNPPTQTKADLAFMKEYGFDACVTAADTATAAK